MYRKIFMISLSLIDDSEIFAKGVLLMFVTFYSFIYHFNKSPFENEILNNIEGLAIRAAALTVFCGMIYMQKNVSDSIQIILFLLIVAINVSFCFTWLKYVVNFALNRYMNKYPIIRKILNMFDNFSLIFSKIRGKIFGKNKFSNN